MQRGEGEVSRLKQSRPQQRKVRGPPQWQPHTRKRTFSYVLCFKHQRHADVFYYISYHWPWKSQCALNFYYFVPERGLEPPWVTPLAPKASASANFATPAYTLSFNKKNYTSFSFFSLVRPVGIEPTTLSLRGICSTNWAMGAFKITKPIRKNITEIWRISNLGFVYCM